MAPIRRLLTAPAPHTRALYQRERRRAREAGMLKLNASCAAIGLRLIGTLVVSAGICSCLAILTASGNGIQSMLQAAYFLLGITLWLLTPLVILRSATYYSLTISAERELGTWEILRTSPLTTWEIVLAKLRAGWLATYDSQALLVIAGLQGLLGIAVIPSLFGPYRSGTYGLPFTSVLVCLLIALQPWCQLLAAALVAMLVSALTHSSQQALLGTYSTLVFTHVVPLWLGPAAGALVAFGLLYSRQLVFTVPLLSLGYLLASPILLAVLVRRVDSLD